MPRAPGTHSAVPCWRRGAYWLPVRRTRHPSRQTTERQPCFTPPGDELVATELIFSGLLADLAPEEAVALLSALVFQVGGSVWCVCVGWGGMSWACLAACPGKFMCR
jgi:hypothetical protein